MGGGGVESDSHKHLIYTKCIHYLTKYKDTLTVGDSLHNRKRHA